MTPERLLCPKTIRASNQNKNLQSAVSMVLKKNAVEMEKLQSR